MDMRAFNEDVIRRFRAGEQIEGMHRDRLLLLTTTGRRSGRHRTTPMMFVDDGSDLLVIASNDGAARDPAWFRNLEANPTVVVETPDGARTDATATVLAGEERAARWAALIVAFPFFAEHQHRAEAREIPLVRLHRAA